VCLDPLGRGYMSSYNGVARSLTLRSCVEFARISQVEIMCQFRWDRVSISPRIHWSSAQIWKIFTEVENVKKESKIRKIELLNFMTILQLTDRLIDRVGSINRSVDRYCTKKTESKGRCPVDRHNSTRITESWEVCVVDRSNRPTGLPTVRPELMLDPT